MPVNLKSEKTLNTVLRFTWIVITAMFIKAGTMKFAKPIEIS